PSLTCLCGATPPPDIYTLSLHDALPILINLSLSGAAYSKTMCDAVTYAISHGSVVVAAAGNDSTSIQEYPAACPGAIGVGATDQDRKSTRLNSSHVSISYAVFCLKKKKK